VAEVGRGRADPKLLAQFAASTMVVAGGMTESDPDAQFRRETCQFVDDRVSAAAKLAFVHDLFRRDMAEVRMFLDRIEALFASLPAKDREAPSSSEALGSHRTRHRLLAIATCASPRTRTFRAPAPA
jgi:hypothetical protein